jgi:hypothetical protein
MNKNINGGKKKEKESNEKIKKIIVKMKKEYIFRKQ